jgi:dGTPase
MAHYLSAPAGLPAKFPARYDRAIKSAAHSGDLRSPAQKDRDRLLYCTEVRRLAEITQVVPSEKSILLHNRLTHTLKVAQIGRRLAERLVQRDAENYDEGKVELAKSLGGLDPDVVESAALAHDLGHPPFGHVAEETLDELLTGHVRKINSITVSDGYEGNAQSFRIVTRLSLRALDDEETKYGLNLTQATLNGIIKYPWFRGKSGKKKRKFGVYKNEEFEYEIFKEARKHALFDGTQSLEASLMDKADDVAYAVYDLEDFYKASLLPLDRLLKEVAELEDKFLEDGEEVNRFYDMVKYRWERQGREDLSKIDDYFKSFADLLLSQTHLYKSLHVPYAGFNAQRAHLRQFTSFLVDRYICAIELNDQAVTDRTKNPSKFADEKILQEITLLKELAWTYIIDGPALAAMQHGQRKIIETLFQYLADAAEARKWQNFSLGIATQMVRDEALWKTAESRLRLVADIISGLTENQAIDLYLRLTGVAAGSIAQSFY